MKTKKRVRRLLSFWLLLVMIISNLAGLVMGMSLKAYADGTTYDPASTYTGFGALITEVEV